MMLVDGGRIVDFTAEEGYYIVQNSSAPSLFSGQFGKALNDAFSRVKFGGTPSSKQQAFFVNLQEIKGIRFGTPSPVNYFDEFYNSELFLRAHGTYSIKITDPIKFYTEAIPKNAARVDINDINEQYLSEFLEAFQAALNRMSIDRIRASQIVAHAPELSKYLSEALDESWKSLRGFEVLAVGIKGISYDEESQKLIHMRNQGAMLGDAAVREGYVQGAVARGIENAGSNSAGSAQAFMGIGMGMGAGGQFTASASASNQAQMQRMEAQRFSPEQEGWVCACGHRSTGKFCSECGKPKPVNDGAWECKCGHRNTGKFCSECGSPRPDAKWVCPKCGAKNSAAARFCPECGTQKA